MGSETSNHAAPGASPWDPTDGDPVFGRLHAALISVAVALSAVTFLLGLILVVR